MTNKPPSRGSVVQEWIAEYCSFKEQTVLLTALRGCDGIPKEDVSKQMVRVMRGVLLKDADASTDFMRSAPHPDDLRQFLTNLDHYPVHWLMHFAHAAQVIAYRHPNPAINGNWLMVYRNIVHALHMEPEPVLIMMHRLEDAPPAE